MRSPADGAVRAEKGTALFIRTERGGTHDDLGTFRRRLRALVVIYIRRVIARADRCHLDGRCLQLHCQPRGQRVESCLRRSIRKRWKVDDGLSAYLSVVIEPIVLLTFTMRPAFAFATSGKNACVTRSAP